MTEGSAGPAYGAGRSPRDEGRPRRGDVVDLAPLVAELRAALGDEHVITHEHQLRTYESDGLLQYAVVPGAVALPASAEEVQAVVRACHRAGVPWVARGAGSGSRGRAAGGGRRADRAHSNSSHTRGRPREPARGRGAWRDQLGRLAGGLTLPLLPPDPSSQIVCSIGGNVAENSGGAHCFKYGFTTNYVTGLELVLADG